MGERRDVADRDVPCPRCGGDTRPGFTRLGRVCRNCSRHVFTVPPHGGRPSGRSTDTWAVILPPFAFGVLVAVTAAVLGDGLSSFDPVVLFAAWGTFAVWGLAPPGPDGRRWLDRLRIR